MFGTTANQPRQPKAPLNVDADKTNSNQEAVAVPWFAGSNRVSVSWITPFYNRKTTKVSQSAGKGGSSQTVGYVYYADFGTLVGCGVYRRSDQLMRLTQVIIDHTPVWTGSLERRAGHPYEEFTIENYGLARIYWGTTDQVPPDDFFSPAQAKGLSPDPQPAYRRFCTLWFKGFKLGRDKTNAPSIDVVIERQPLWFADQPSPEVGGGGANAAAILYEWLVDPTWGLGWDESQLVKQTWLDTFAAIDGQRLSPLITQQQDFRQQVAGLLEYFDGFLRRVNGALALGYFPHGNVDTSGIVEVTDADLTEEPELTSSGWDQTINQVLITYRDNTRYFKSVGALFAEPANRRATGMLLADHIDRPALISEADALFHANEYLTIKSRPRYRGPVKIKREKVAALLPGDRIKISSTAYGLSIICRITEKSTPADASGVAELTLENEPALWPARYTPPANPRDPDFRVSAEKITSARIVELPSGLKDSASIQVAILAERPDPLLTGFAIHLSPDGTSYDLIDHEASFAIRGTLTAAYPSTDDGTVGFTVEIVSDDAYLVASQSAQQQADNQLLAWLDGEIVSVGSVTAIGSSVYRVSCARGRFATAIADHFSAANVWFASRTQMALVEHASFVLGATDYFKFQTHTDRADEDLSECDVFTHTFGADDPVGSTFGIILSTYAQADASGQIESHLRATWQFPTDQKIFLFEVQSKPASADDSAWFAQTTHATSLDWIVAASTVFQVRIRAITSDGQPGAWSAVQTIKSASLSPYQITGLELVGRANGLIFYEPDAHFQWRLNSPSRYDDLGSETDGAQGALTDPNFGGYQVRILDADTRAVAWAEIVQQPSYTFSFSKNSQAFGGQPHNRFTIQVSGLDKQGQEGDPAELTVSNPPPAPPSSLSVIAAFQGFQASWINPSDIDLAGIEVLYGTSTNVSLATVLDAGKTQVKAINPNAGTGATLCCWVRAYDDFGSRSGVTGPVTFTLGTVPASSIDGLAKKLSLQFTNTVQLEGYSWTNHSPTSDAIQWTAATGASVWWKGVVYAVAGGSTNLLYVWWKGGETSFRVSDANPLDSADWNNADSFVIARNFGHAGVAEIVWQTITNLSAGSFFALYAAIKSGVFGTLVADTVDVIGTLQLQGQAVTIPASISAGLYAVPATVYSAALALTVTSTGAPARIAISFQASDDQTHTGTTLELVQVVVKRSDGAYVLVAEGKPFAGSTTAMFFEATDSATLVGTATYTLYVQGLQSGTTYVPFSLRNPQLDYLEVKR
ncbi:MAG: hypothetical protein JO295_14385 [Verrucomicrobia bacterium]|nr:hypothetical protein [Verrucomicrobiota bacterium]